MYESLQSEEINKSVSLENGGVVIDSIKNILDYKGYLFTTKHFKIDQSLIDKFSEITGDHNPAHTSSENSKDSIFGGVVAHGFLGVSLMANSEAIWKVFEIREKYELIARGFNVTFFRPVGVESEIMYEFSLADANLSKIKDFDSCCVDWNVTAKVNNKKVFESVWNLEYIDKSPKESK
jgi:acyl dehydratase